MPKAAREPMNEKLSIGGEACYYGSLMKCACVWVRHLVSKR